MVDADAEGWPARGDRLAGFDESRLSLALAVGGGKAERTTRAEHEGEVIGAAVLCEQAPRFVVTPAAWKSTETIPRSSRLRAGSSGTSQASCVAIGAWITR